MLFGELQRVNHAQHFVDVAAQRQVVHHLVLHHAGAVDQERAAESDAAIGFNVEGLAQFVLDIGHQGVANLADAALFHRGVAPCGVGELAVDGHADHFHVLGFEVGQTVVESDQFGRAHEGEVQRVEEYYRVFAGGSLLEGVVVNDLTIAQHGGEGFRAIEEGGLFANEYGHCGSP